MAIGDATDYIQKAAAEVVPPSLRASLQGEALTFRNTVRDLTILMFLAVFVMYVILAILYESYLHPITVLSTLPTALVGGLLALYLFGEQASLYAFVGMFMLMGIVKKNGIMIVDFARQRVDKGETAEKAIHDASMDRFRPILMTTLAAVFGALPIALGFGAGRGVAAAARAGHRRRPGRVAAHHALHHAGHLSVPGGVPGEGPEQNGVLPFRAPASIRGRAVFAARELR